MQLKFEYHWLNVIFLDLAVIVLDGVNQYKLYD